MALDVSLTTDYEALTQGAGLVDRSERGKLLLTGGDVKDFLQGQVTNDVEALTEGTGCYAAHLTHKGKMLGDMRLLDGGPAGMWLDCERETLQELFNMLRRFKLGREVEVHKRTLERALFSVVGPRSPRRTEHEHELVRVGDVQVREVGTDLGVDYICDAADADRLREALGLPEVSAEAAEIVRVESGRPRYGPDLDDTVIPQEAGLNERAVSFTKGCYVGQETVARLFYRGKPNRRLMGLRLSEALPGGTELRLGEKVVATVRSSVVSPAHGPIALALVRREAEAGAELHAEGGATARVVQLPFADCHPAAG